MPSTPDPAPAPLSKPRTASPAQSDGVREPPRGRVLRIMLYAVGVLLLAAAVIIVVRDGDTMRQALDAARWAPAWMFALLLVLPVLNWLLTSVVLWLLTRRFAPVPLSDMSALTAVATMLNVLPLRPGLLGRIVYLRQAHGVRVRDALRVVIESMVLTLTAAAVTLAAVHTLGPWGWLVAALVLCSPMAMARLGVRDPALGRHGSPALCVRAMEMAVWTTRYWLVFAIVGRPIDMPAAVMLAAAAQTVALLPIAVGLREWTVALLSAGTPIGLTADLLHRAAELAVSLPLGGAGAWWLWRRRAPATRACKR